MDRVYVSVRVDAERAPNHARHQYKYIYTDFMTRPQQVRHAVCATGHGHGTVIAAPAADQDLEIVTAEGAPPALALVTVCPLPSPLAVSHT